MSEQSFAGLVETTFEVSEKKYILREASGGAVRKYRNHMASCAKFDKKGEFAGAQGPVADSMFILISECTFDVGEEPLSKVQFKEIEQWPNKAVKWAFKWINDCSEIEDKVEEEEEKAKNESETSTVGSD